MIITLEPEAPAQEVLRAVRDLVQHYPGVTPKLYEFRGSHQTLIEIHLIGDTKAITTEPFGALPGVRGVIRVSVKYRIIGRPPGSREPPGFCYNDVRFDDSTVNIFAGLCAVDTREHVAEMMRALAEHGVTTTRMGVYKPRTSPYDFQGLGKDCLPWLFELAGQHGIKVIALEGCDVRHIEEIHQALESAGNPTGVMLQVGTRNAQNFELLKQLGQQRIYPVLYKRGMGLSIEESLNACEYIASEGNPNIVFGLRGVKTHLGDPHRNLIDFAHVPVIRRLTRLAVCIDPSHSVGSLQGTPDGIPDIFHATGQGIIVGASMVLVEFHPNPSAARCDGHQALVLSQLPQLLEYIRRVRSAYEEVTGRGEG
jgi:3-deoxy-7-phosphoheptulonate synthase